MDETQPFFQNVRSTLNHLYDPEYLARSPLVGLFGLASRYDPAAALQQRLIHAIEALRPQGAGLLAARDQQAHDLLLYRYVQRLTQDDIAHQFGISERQLRRDQNRAVQLLAGRLWEEYGPAQGSATETPAETPTGQPTGDESFAWLVRNPAECLTDPNQTLVTVGELAQALAERHGVRLAWPAPADLPPLAVHPIAFRQMVLGLLGHALPCAGGGRCALAATRSPAGLTFEITAQWPDAGRPVAAADLVQVEELVGLFGGRLAHASGPGRLTYRLDLPICDQWPVLVIDDNADILQLLARYVAGTRYRVIPAPDPGQVFELLEVHAPWLIVLDVMMPRMDGWELLRKLRGHPPARRLPIIVCTIMNQPELAYALGANVFLRKPVTQAAFLAALEQSAAPESGSR
jgi:CheY-like chemotaxis protein